MKRLSLDPNDIPFDSDGIDGFYYPVARNEVTRFRDECLRNVIPTVRKARDRDDNAVNFEVLLGLFVHRTLSCFRSHLLVKRVREAGGYIDPGAENHLINALWEGRTPSEYPQLQSIQQVALSTSREWVPSVARRAKWSLRWNGLNVDGLLPIDPAEDIVAIYPDPLIEKHAQTIPDTVKYRPVDRWVDSVKPDEDFSVSETTISEVIGAVASAFSQVGVVLPESLESYLEGYVRQGSATIGAHMNRIRREEEIPERLWMGSGQVWAQLVARLVREKGGTVVVHDHGRGAGVFAPMPNALTSYGVCDRFITHTESIARVYREETPPYVLVDGELPTVEAVPHEGPSKLLYSGPLPEAPDTVNTVMYVSTLYPGESTHLNPALSEPVAVDWQARLLSRLSDWGYSVLHKPHPEGTYQSPDFASVLDVETLDGPFEEVIQEADVLLFDFPFSTTFAVGLMSQLPVVFVDFGYLDLPEWVIDPLRTRCRVVPGEFDPSNRATVDWDGLEEALREANGDHDREFVRRFLTY